MLPEKCRLVENSLLSSVLGLENAKDWGAWWAAVYGVTQSWTQLKQLSMCANEVTYNLRRDLKQLSPFHNKCSIQS